MKRLSGSIEASSPTFAASTQAIHCTSTAGRESVTVKAKLLPADAPIATDAKGLRWIPGLPQTPNRSDPTSIRTVWVFPHPSRRPPPGSAAPP